MSDFAANFVPISVPALPSDADANDIARFQANFVSNIVTSANSVINASQAAKDSDFFSVGDIPVLGPQLLFLDQDLFVKAKSNPTRTDPLMDWTALSSKLDQLAQLATPSAPTLTTATIDVPVLDAAAPVLTLPVAPSADVGAAPSNAPNVIDPAMPDAPLITLPSLPTFEELQLPAAPTYQLPSFDLSAPQNQLAPPTAQFSYVDTGYASSLHDPLVVKLLSDLQNGSYGIDSGDEAALWFRARDRAAQQARTEVEEALRRAAATTFTMPQGSVTAAVEIAEDKGQKSLSEANREIALRRSELYVEGRKFTIQQVQSYEKIRIDLYNATQERALNYSKSVVELGVVVYEAGVKNYQAQLEGYKAEAQVFGERIRGELAKAELYKSQVEAERLRVDFNRAKLDAFQAQVNAINATVELYKSRIAAANALMQVQAQRLDVFRTQVSAYSERVRAKEAEYNIYQAQIRGQLAQVDVYKSQIDAYNARLSGLDTRARIQVQNNEALLQSFRVASQSYGNQLESFNKQVSARLDEARTKGMLYATDIDAYRAAVSGAMESAKVQTDLSRFNLEWNRSTLATRVAQIEFRLRQLGMSVDLQKDVNNHGTEFMRSALAGSLSGLNALGVSSVSA